MQNKNKKLLYGLLVLLVLTPIGILLPDYFKAGDAWGEWSVETVKEQTGQAPEGMKKDAELWKAPIADYTLNPKDSSLKKQSVYYIISGIVGVAIITLLSFGISKLIKKNV